MSSDDVFFLFCLILWHAFEQSISTRKHNSIVNNQVICKLVLYNFFWLKRRFVYVESKLFNYYSTTYPFLFITLGRYSDFITLVFFLYSITLQNNNGWLLPLSLFFVHILISRTFTHSKSYYCFVSTLYCTYISYPNQPIDCCVHVLFIESTPMVDILQFIYQLCAIRFNCCEIKGFVLLVHTIRTE